MLSIIAAAGGGVVVEVMLTTGPEVYSTVVVVVVSLDFRVFVMKIVLFCRIEHSSSHPSQGVPEERGQTVGRFGIHQPTSIRSPPEPLLPLTYVGSYRASIGGLYN